MKEKGFEVIEEKYATMIMMDIPHNLTISNLVEWLETFVIKDLKKMVGNIKISRINIDTCNRLIIEFTKPRLTRMLYYE